MGRKKEDTYENASKKKQEQIEKEQVVHNKNAKLEADVLGVWDKYVELDYGQYTMRIAADLPIPDHNELMSLIDDISDDNDANISIYQRIGALLSMGLYDGEEMINPTDAEFWSNLANWSQLKVQQMFQMYKTNYVAELTKIISFRGEQPEQS
jgi:hypothetical protein